MNTQDLFLYNSFLLGINNQYISLPDERFLVNCKEVLAKENIISLGKNYLLIMSLKGELQIMVVSLEDVFHDGEKLHIILYDKRNNEMIFLQYYLTEDSDSTQD